MWSKKYCDAHCGQNLPDVLRGFLDYINFHMIPANVLMKEIHPLGKFSSSLSKMILSNDNEICTFFLGIVPYDIIMKALAYQADPQSVDPVVKTNPPKEVRKKLIFYHYWIGT